MAGMRYMLDCLCLDHDDYEAACKDVDRYESLVRNGRAGANVAGERFQFNRENSGYFRAYPRIRKRAE